MAAYCGISQIIGPENDAAATEDSKGAARVRVLGPLGYMAAGGCTFGWVATIGS